MFCTFKLNFDVDILAFFFCLLSILATFQKIGNFFHSYGRPDPGHIFEIFTKTLFLGLS